MSLSIRTFLSLLRSTIVCVYGCFVWRSFLDSLCGLFAKHLRSTQVIHFIKDVAFPPSIFYYHLCLIVTKEPRVSWRYRVHSTLSTGETTVAAERNLQSSLVDQRNGEDAVLELRFPRSNFCFVLFLVFPSISGISPIHRFISTVAPRVSFS